MWLVARDLFSLSLSLHEKYLIDHKGIQGIIIDSDLSFQKAMSSKQQNIYRLKTRTPVRGLMSQACTCTHAAQKAAVKGQNNRLWNVELTPIYPSTGSSAALQLLLEDSWHISDEICHPSNKLWVSWTCLQKPPVGILNRSWLPPLNVKDLFFNEALCT